ncbi:MAG TPA: heme-binding protein, partial [Casimicrobiaceae bacterium]|nr:heme-binding protein [Casimicrobiaceae bacterium]
MSASARSMLAALGLAALVAGCGGGAGNGGGSAQPPAPDALTAADVQQVIAQAVFEAQARNANATIAVVDRVGNVLAVFNMNGAPADFTINPLRPVTGGLNYFKSPNGAPLAAIAMAVTGAYLSSQGNAFSTRTASQIVQEHFNPGESNQPGGPLFGVQFSSLACSDINQPASAGTIGPKPTPLGLSANPGGLPLYKNGTVVGGVGAISNGVYTLDPDIEDVDTDPNELIAVAGTYGFAAPADRQADQITVDGRTLRYVDSTSTASNPAQAPPFSSLGAVGALLDVPGYGG